MLYDVICEVQRNIFGVLFGLNKMYVHHPAFKWMPNNVERMAIKPEKLYERMADTLIGIQKKCAGVRVANRRSVATSSYIRTRSKCG